MTDARRLAADVLLQVDRQRAFADAALGAALARESLSGEDRGLATRLVYGALAWQLRLDHTIDAYASRSRVDPRVRIALRVGLFQLAFLDRVPQYAAVDTTVENVRAFAPHAAGFTNALLRRATREGLAPLPPAEPERTAVELSHPEWLVDMWRRELGDDEARALMDANNRPSPTVLRALVPRQSAIAVLQERGCEAAPARFAPDAIVCTAPSGAPGIAIPQGEASQLVALFVGVENGQSVLDTCAAPGGKTAYLSSLVGESGRVLAVDRAPRARTRIERTCHAAGCGNVDVVESAIEDVRDRGEFDAVLADAPCSGLGTLREHPEIRWRRGPADVEQLAERQAAILRAAARHVRRGGVLVYATCTLTRAENDDVVDAFLAAHTEFHEDAGRVHPAVAGFLDARGRLRTWPHRHDMAGFFAARMRRVA
jgi:16S rRNA (cytosine967-C5)-methyltransferase